MKIRSSNMIQLSALSAALAVGLSGCALLSPTPTLPPALDVPTGHSVFTSADAEGSTIRVCRAQGNAYAWSSPEVEATLRDVRGAAIGRFYGTPMTWEAADGSIVTGQVVATAASEGKEDVFQLVRANPATGMGAMRGVSYIQRTAFATPAANTASGECNAARVGETQRSPYRASFRFFKPTPSAANTR